MRERMAKFKGTRDKTFTVNAPVERVARLMSDPEEFKEVMNSLERFEKVAEDTYLWVLEEKREKGPPTKTGKVRFKLSGKKLKNTMREAEVTKWSSSPGPANALKNHSNADRESALLEQQHRARRVVVHEDVRPLPHARDHRLHPEGRRGRRKRIHRRRRRHHGRVADVGRVRVAGGVVVADVAPPAGTITW